MRLLVIGNGFDLDMGVPTRYSDFIHSTESVFLSRWQELPDCLVSYLLECSNFQWFDIEETMAEYVKAKENNNDYTYVEIDKLILNELKKQFSEYVDNKLMHIGSISWKQSIKKSLAKEIIEMQNRSKCFNNIYSFNCFDCFNYELATNFEIESLSGVVNIHGSGDDFILGICDHDCRSDEYSFLKKTNQKGYPHEIISQFKSDLMKADDIFIFGHSLNRIDMVYFKDMLRNIYLYQNTHKRITIITKNANTAEQIKENISNHAPIPYEELSSSCQLKFLYTDNYISSKRINNIEDLFNM